MNSNLLSHKKYLNFTKYFSVKLIALTYCAISVGQELPVQSSGFTTTIRFCNTSSLNLSAAYVFLNGTDGWTSKGWYSVKAHSCKNLAIGTFYTGNVYVYAQANGGKTVWGGQDASFCIDGTNAFSIPTSDRDLSGCRAGGFKVVKMRKFDVQVGINTWTFQPNLFDFYSR